MLLQLLSFGANRNRDLYTQLLCTGGCDGVKHAKLAPAESGHVLQGPACGCGSSSTNHIDMSYINRTQLGNLTHFDIPKPKVMAESHLRFVTETCFEIIIIANYSEIY
jgi:hypothetical protein